MDNQSSIVEYYAEHDRYKCGYCNSPDTNYSHGKKCGMWAHLMTVSDYQDLIDRGWRRSGKYCYKPTMDVTCCPMYTIRCRALQFKPSKSQKKILKRFNKCVSSTDVNMEQSRKMSTCSEEDGTGDCTEQFIEANRTPKQLDISNEIVLSTQGLTKNSIENDTPQGSTCSSSQDCTQQKNVSAGPDPNKAPCKKAKQLRKERKLEKLIKKGIDVTKMELSNKNKEKQLEEFINELPEDFQKKIEIKLVRTTPPSAEYLSTEKETHTVYAKYQMKIHGDKPDKCGLSKFKDFLVHSPLMPEIPDDGPDCGYGSFHQQYWLSGKLIAVGVIDILPKCVSSVYYFYDPDYRHLTLGTYGALREISFTRQLTEQSPELKYYYMGFYVHSCRKMRYKGNFSPSDLLCPETYKWFEIEQCLPKLDASPYSRLDPDIDSLDDNCPTDNQMNYIQVLYKRVIMPYKDYKRKYCDTDSGEIKQYAHLTGANVVQRMILVR